ncbi:MAG: 1-phosphofructokinase [Aerococcus sp.]|nr:1-phosphofructokinase [Aerococcus sp.]
MIYTLTLNPAIDLFIQTEAMEPKIVNRTDYSEATANGKGINVSFILQKLDVVNTALGVGGGFTNQYIEDVLTQRGIAHDFVHVDGMTRINVFAQVTTTADEYKLVNPGPTVDEAKQMELLQKLEALQSDDMLIISGSFAKGIDPAILTRIAALAAKQQFKLVIDTSYKEVMDTLTYRPALLKPNDEELQTWFDLDHVPDCSECITLGKELRARGAEKVLISLGSEGALLVSESGVIHGSAPHGEAVNTTCAGDTMLGTFVASQLRGLSEHESLVQAIAAGSSTAFTSGLTDFRDVPTLAKDVQLTMYD